MRGDIDAVHEVSPGAMDFVENQSTVSTFPHTRPYFIQLLFNFRHPALRKSAVRQALSHAVDREAMVKTALHGRGIVADSPVWPQHWAYVVPPKTYRLNTEAARLLLDTAGVVVKPSSEAGRMKSRFRFVCLTLENDARYEKIGILLQKQLYDIGVDMEVVALPWKELAARLAKNDFDALLLERTSGRSLAWAYYNYHSSMGLSGYHAADAVLNDLRRASSDNDTRVAVNEFLQILYDDPPALFLAWPVVARAVSNKFVVPAETGRDVMGSLWQWQPMSKPAP
jgi:peptide/nickel transport system substrate-binding protein